MNKARVIARRTETVNDAGMLVDVKEVKFIVPEDFFRSLSLQDGILLNASLCIAESIVEGWSVEETLKRVENLPRQVADAVVALQHLIPDS